MTEHYVTLFDSGFLANGVAMHTSFMRHAGDFHLWILAMDARAHEVLAHLNLPNVTSIPLSEAESSRLLEVKPGRTMGEYCWTLTPFTPSLVFEREPTAARATYVDADMWLTASPAPIFLELDKSGAGTLITDHAYAERYRSAEKWGIYCVQFMPFVRGTGDDVLHWWQDRVIEWCYAREEDGKFGDQKYLDDWPSRFGGAVHVLQEPWLTQAPWNALRFAAERAAMFHFHRLRIAGPTTATVGLYELPKEHQKLLYRPYLQDLRGALHALERVGFSAPIQSALPAGWAGVKDRLAFRMLNWRSPLTPYSLEF